MATQREASRDNWKAEPLTLETINSGSLQRIADAAEKMAQSYTDLIAERDKWKQRYIDENRDWQEQVKICESRNRQIAALRGVITRMKRYSAAQLPTPRRKG